MSAETVGEITEFITEALGQAVGPDDDYFARGLADSLFALELVTFVEERYHLTVDVEDLDLDSFRTAASVARFVARKTAAPASPAAPRGEAPNEAPAEAPAEVLAEAPAGAPEFATGHDGHR